MTLLNTFSLVKHRFTKSSEKHKEVENKEKDIDDLQKKLKQM